MIRLVIPKTIYSYFTITKILLVAIGGAFGATMRYGLNLLFANVFAPFPFATFIINVTGSFLIGFFLSKF